VDHEVRVTVGIGVDGVVNETLSWRPAPGALGRVVLTIREEELCSLVIPAPMESTAGVDQTFDLDLVAVEQQTDQRVEIVEFWVGRDYRPGPHR
jgi:hypothetical protein